MILSEKTRSFLSGIDEVLIAVSGGVDSIALLQAVHVECTEIKILAVHVDHQLRDESASEGQFVSEFCKERAIQCQLKSITINPNTSLQLTARTQRHAILRRTAAQFGITHILTAHHLDDYAETLMMNMGRGGGVGALAFNIERTHSPFSYVRPFSDVSREEIISYVKAHNLRWCEDPSNKKDAYLRNRIRHNLEDLRVYYGKGLKQSASRLRDAASIIKRSTKRVWDENLISSGPYHITFSADRLGSDICLLREFLREVSRSYFGITLNENNIDQCVCAIQSKTQASLSLHGIQVDLSASRIRFRKNFGRGNRWWSDLGQKCVLELQASKNHYRWFDWKFEVLENSAFWLQLRDGTKAQIRNWENGMLRGGKSLSKIIKSHPKNERWRVPCLIINEKIIWVLGDPEPVDLLGIRWKNDDGALIEI